MQAQEKKSIRRPYWLAIVMALVAGCVLSATPSWAGPAQQGSTVPTATPTTSVGPTATATPQAAARATPTTSSTTSPTTSPTPTDLAFDNNDVDNSGSTGSGSAGSGAGGAGASLRPTPTEPASGTCLSEPPTTLNMLLTVGAIAVRPGQTVQLDFVIINEGEESACNVHWRNELPSTLEFVSMQAHNAQGTQTNNGNRGAATVNVIWPEVAAGAQVTTTLTLKVAAGSRAGQIIDDLAAVRADNAPEIGIGVSLGLPPALPPSFRE